MYLLLAVAAGYAAVFVWGMINRSYEGWYNVCWRVSCYFPGITLGEGHAPVSQHVQTYHCLQACDIQHYILSPVAHLHEATNLCARASNAASRCAGVLSVLNLLIWHTGSSGAIPLGAFFSLVSLWFIISIPLCYSGAAVQILDRLSSSPLFMGRYAETSSSAQQITICRARLQAD
jgi:transmembrane 9 superfamily member 2/4